jgi:GNAT superfamily N-acetyltransferase
MRANEFITEYKTDPKLEDYEGLRFKIDVHDFYHQINVSAYPPKSNKEIGRVLFDILDHRQLEPLDLQVDEKFRGQGIAKIMYDYVKSKGYAIHRSWDQTEAGAKFWNKNRGEDVRVWEESNSTNIVSAEQIWGYISKIHPKDQQGGGFLKSLIMLNPQYELKRVPLTSLHIPNDEDDGNDPYGRAMYVDVDHANEYSQYQVDKKPLVVDSQGYILDGAHRAWAASELLNKKDIMAYVPVKNRISTPQDLEIRKKFTNQNVTEGQSIAQEIKQFIDSLTPDDVGVEQFPGYRVHYEGFTDDCKSSADYKKNPNKVYKQVYQDFVDREHGQKPVKSGMAGDEDYPVLYSVFKVPQSKTVDTAEKAYNIAYKKKQPWPRGSREEKLIRSDWQLSQLYDQYVVKQGVAEGSNNESPDHLVSEFLKNISPKELRYYTIRDNCGPAALHMKDWAEGKGIDLIRHEGYFVADTVVYDKADFTKEMKREFIEQGLDFNDPTARKQFIESNPKYSEEWKKIPHYWLQDKQGNIYDPTGYIQFVKTGLSSDLDKSRYKPIRQGVAEVVNKELWHPERMFKQRVPIGDYEFEARETIGGMGDYDANALTIIAYDPRRKKNKQVIGNANFVVKGRGSKRSLVSDDTYVDPKYRGEGIATMMYAYAKSLGNDIKGSNIQTPMGKKMWANWGSDAEHLKGNK